MSAMPQLHHIDHFTLRVHPRELAPLRDFYATVLGLHEGWRPAFDFPGHWLYAADRPVVHLAGNAPAGEGAADAALPTGKFNHVSFRSTGLAAMREHLRALGVTWREAPVPGAPLHQIFLHDPAGLKVELTFDQAEFEAAGVADGIERDY
ncbi:VOC family protein [Variovorax terrae]|uniref:VOC family protein n=1 Tax=Variovorax terrae TaxID=2923278 RepID=A0A9X1VYH8_9BURK|nr:VOC family protein [Variovorax terrae]MCJ0765700.1 VOC family protein [Variovorax terrae]